MEVLKCMLLYKNSNWKECNPWFGISEIVLQGIITQEREVSINMDIPSIMADDDSSECNNTIRVTVSPDMTPASYLAVEFLIAFLIGIMGYIFMWYELCGSYYSFRSIAAFFIGMYK